MNIATSACLFESAWYDNDIRRPGGCDSSDLPTRVWSDRSCREQQLITRRTGVRQVLDALADPNAPPELLAAKLRFVATAVTRQDNQEFAEWLGDGLFERLLDILRRLPDMALDDADAAEVCAAAAAGISNIIHEAHEFPVDPQLLELAVIPPADSLRQSASCVEVLRSLVRYGLVNPAATQQLPPGHEVLMTATQGGVPTAVYAQTSCTTRTSREFWTPWRICIVTICDRVIVGGNHMLPAMAAELAPVVTPATFQQLLSSAIGQPCGEPHMCSSHSKAYSVSLHGT
jgi:hypothetical protein